jgi:hypothetical protein
VNEGWVRWEFASFELVLIPSVEKICVCARASVCFTKKVFGLTLMIGIERKGVRSSRGYIYGGILGSDSEESPSLPPHLLYRYK